MQKAGKLLILSGPPCSGKSSIAEAIQQRRDFHWLQLDRILRRLMPDSLHDRKDRDIAYRAMHFFAEELLRGGRSAVLDATYSSTEQRAAVEAIAGALAIPFYLIECRVSPDTAAARFKERTAHPALDLTEALVRDVGSRYCYSGEGLALAEAASLADNLQQIEIYLRNGTPLPSGNRWSTAARSYVRTA
jgi:predicted kinase